MPRCGNCKGNHETVDEVRACYGVGQTRRTTTTPGRVPLHGALDEGFFTVVLERDDAAPDHVTLRVRRQPEDAEFMAGRQLVGYLAGPDNTSNYVNFAHVIEGDHVGMWKRHRDNVRLRSALQVLLEAPTDALRENYAMRSGNCSRCGRTLTVPASLHLGMGPVCAQKAGVA